MSTKLILRLAASNPLVHGWVEKTSIFLETNSKFAPWKKQKDQTLAPQANYPIQNFRCYVSFRDEIKKLCDMDGNLVGGFNPPEKIQVKWDHFPK